MHIAVHISSPLKQESILKTILAQVCKINSSCKTMLFCDADIKSISTNESFTKISLKPYKKIAYYIWTHHTLPSLLKKSTPNVFINEFGYSIKKINTLNYLFFSNTDFLKKLPYTNKKTFAKSLHECKKIFVTEDFISNVLVEKYAIAVEKIVTTYYQLSENCSKLNYEEKEAIKEQYTQGVDYFLYEINNNNTSHLITILKSFSKLKKWQKSSIKLLILANDNNGENLIADFKNYKYKEDVCFLNKNSQNISSIVAASFALIYFSDYESNSIAFSALQNNVPVIALENESNKVLFEKAAIFANNETLALQMQLLYKDDFICNELQINGQALLEKYDSLKAASILYNTIIKEK
jgi:hypothetical protein